METTYYTTAEAARILGTHQKTVAAWARRGRLAGARLRLGSPKLGYEIPRELIDGLKAGRWTLETLPAELPPAELDGGARHGDGGGAAD